MNKIKIEIPEIKEFLQIEGGINDFVYYKYTAGNLLNTGFPLRINGFAAGVCLNGWMDISVGLHRFRLSKNQFIIIFPCYIIQVHEVSPDFELESIIVSTDFMDAIDISSDKIINPYFYIEERPVVSIEDKKDLDLIQTMYNSIYNLTKFSQLPYYRQMIQHFVYGFLFSVGYIYEQFVAKTNSQEFISNTSLLKRFFSLLQKNFKKEHTVKFYADQLFVTPKYLSFYISKASGKSVKEWIHEILILEAKVLLHRNKMSIQQIANELHFSDQAAFATFFKKHVDMPPKEYKQQN